MVELAVRGIKLVGRVNEPLRFGVDRADENVPAVLYDLRFAQRAMERDDVSEHDVRSARSSRRASLRLPTAR